VWLGRRGWVRVDPTAAVSPARVQRGIDQVLSGLAIGSAQEGARRGTRAVLNRLRYVYDAVNNRWNLWVIGYNARRQTALFERFGMEVDRRSLAVALFSALLLTLALTAAVLLRSMRPHGDPARRAYEQFCRKLARRGQVRAPHEGPHDFARRVSASLPKTASEVARITDLYTRARYEPSPPEDSAAALARAVRRFTAR
jgi:hypothetical protein